MKEALVLCLPNTNLVSISELPLHHWSQLQELLQARQCEAARQPQWGTAQDTGHDPCLVSWSPSAYTHMSCPMILVIHQAYTRHLMEDSVEGFPTGRIPNETYLTIQQVGRAWTELLTFHQPFQIVSQSHVPYPLSAISSWLVLSQSRQWTWHRLRCPSFVCFGHGGIHRERSEAWSHVLCRSWVS